MATSVDLHGVSYDDVLDTLPADTRHVSATSAGLNYGQIDGFIARAAGQVNALLARHGLTLDANGTQLARDAIIAYAAAYSLERIGAAAEQIDRRMREWDRLTKQLASEPQNVGVAQDDAGTLGVKSNAPSTPTARRWGSGASRRF